MYDSNIEQIGLSNSQLEIIELPNRGKFLYSKIGNISVITRISNKLCSEF